mmetsp:Transcript_36054/g.58175  ORF Transcript_36054/g.58175 Transcript_36054/m.58175 type:complete len:465 (-) Transcript_36054:528-1922(-)
MGACGKCCSCLKCFFLILVFMVCLFVVPLTRDPLMFETHKRADNLPVFMAGFMLRMLGWLCSCSPSLATDGKQGFLTCVKDSMTDDNALLYGWNPGFGVSMMDNKDIGPIAFGHAAYKQITYDTTMGRTPNKLSKLDLTTGVMSPGMDKLPINFATGDPEWVKRRTLIVDSFPSLLEKPPVTTDFVTPKGVHSTAFASERAIQDFVGLNLFKQLFEADVSAELDCMNEYDDLIKKAFAAGSGSAISAIGGLEKLEKCRQALYARVADTAPAQNMNAAAGKLGYDGKTRIIDFIWILMFAGYGGTGDLTIGTFNMVRRNPEKMLKLYRKDPDAFLLESARLNPPVGGQNPSVLTQNLTIQNVDGTPRTFQPGTWTGVLTSGANKDPTLYPDPYEFKPDRANLDRILTWNAELRDIRKCKNTAGFPSCKEAPRPCPGTWLALRTAKAAIAFFMDGVEKSLGKKGEL